MKDTNLPEKSEERSLRISKTLEFMKSCGMVAPSSKVYLSVPDAKNVLRDYFYTFLELYGKRLVWQREYDEIADWLSDNKGLGLFMYGECGLGKSFLGRYVLPAILIEYHNLMLKVYNVQEMNRDIDLILSRKIIYIDDVGTEDIAHHYGNKRLAFAEVMDAVEKEDKLIVVSTNLNSEEIIEMYGERVMDRIKETTKRVKFLGESFRGKIK